MLIQLKEVCKTYDKKNIIDIKSLNIEAGKIYGIVGKNGAGKTTLFRLLAGLTYPTNGVITYETPDMRVGVMIEQPAIDLNMTAWENLTWIAKLYGYEGCREIQDILKLVKLDGYKKLKAQKFSLGMKQRLGIAMCLLANPKLLILDEPMNGLDPEGIIEFRELLLEIHKTGTTILISSHILGELYKLATDYVFIKEGKIIQQTTLLELEKNNISTYEMVTSNNQKAVQILENNFSVSTIMENERICFKVSEEHILEISKMLAYEAVFITRLTEHEFDIEAYYMEVVGDK